MFSDTLQLDPHRLPQKYTPRVRNLGAAILLVAVQDYRCTDEEQHQDAAAFLYPSPESQAHYDWVVSLHGLDPAWLRERLDSSRLKWDAQRARRTN